MAKLLWIASGGAIGALLRYGLVVGVHRVMGPGFPWGTLSVNVGGSLVIGVVWALAERSSFSTALSAFVLIGVLGAFTTFSSFAMETVNLAREGRHLMAAANILASNALCILAAFAGMKLAQLLAG